MEIVELFMVPSFWFDMICLVLFIVFCARYVTLGFLSSVVQIFGTAISLVAAHVFATFADTPVYEFFFEDMVQAKVETYLIADEAHGLESLSEVLISVLPESLLNMWEDKLIDVASLEMLGDVSSIVQIIMESTVAPIITQIIFMVLFFGTFLICRVIAFFLVKALRVANYIPVLGSVNRILGWVFGVLGGCVDMFLAMCVLWVVILLTDGIIPVLNETDLATSYFFAFFQWYNPFL